MAAFTTKHVTIIGVGLLGGSVGLALRKRFPRAIIAGVGRRKASLQKALQRGCIHTAHLDPADCVGRSDLVILATPVGAFEEYLRAIRPALRRGTLVTDVGSTKELIVRAGERILGAGTFVGSHPMAGSENKGPQFAEPNLLKGALCVVTPTPRTSSARLARTEALWRALGMRTLRLSPAKHDRAVAAVSHVPHAAAAMLMLLPQDAHLPVAATGLRDMTRLAGGDPEVWRDVLLTNRRAILDALGRFGRSLDSLRAILRRGDARAVERFLARAKRRRDDWLI
jgi:prephenate dehydrogenase